MRWTLLFRSSWMLGALLLQAPGCQTGGQAGDACAARGRACQAGLFCYEGSCHDGALVAARSGRVTPGVDVLFVVDASGSRVPTQLQLGTAFSSLTGVLDARFGPGAFHVGVITVGMESPGCPPCDGLITASCMNPSGESGRLQDRQGWITDTSTDPPTFAFGPSDPTCRVVTSENRACFYDPSGGGLSGSGTVLVGTNGCGYERGLEPMRAALSTYADSYNAGFQREEATLVVVVVSNEEDCGAVGDVTESISGIGGRVCYYATEGEGPDGAVIDPEGKPYALTPVQDYFDFLMELKHGQEGMVKFAAVVGVTDPDNPSATEIEYGSTASNAEPEFACDTPGCTGSNCRSYPGTRYIALADLFGLGENGLVDTICQSDFDRTLTLVGELAACPHVVWLREPPSEPETLEVAVDGLALPRFSCAVPGLPQACTGPADTACTCVASWSYHPPTDAALGMNKGGEIALAPHLDPCAWRSSGRVELQVFRPLFRM
jgi:hypothetical protein